uniref:Uncharacterized protein n=1 Tax=Acrobeloides nanus TaxID=290746 RepID=A0A914BWP9_9BILA
MNVDSCPEVNQLRKSVMTKTEDDRNKMYEATFACYKRIYEQANCVPYGWESTCLMLLTQPGDGGSVSDHIATIEKLRYICTKN